MTLTEFLLARIAEDESIARRLISLRNVGGHQTSPDEENDDAGPCPDECVGHFSPARVLAECAAKRRIIEHVADDDSQAEMFGTDVVPRILASIYADHPDYRPEWTL